MSTNTLSNATRNELTRPQSTATSPSVGLSPEEFRNAFRNHPGGVAVITADPGTGPVGLTATSVISVSLDPPLIVFSVSEHSSSTPAILQSETVVIHLLGAAQLHIARLCSTSGIDRFADTSLWSRLPSGEPYFTGASNWIRGKCVSTMSAGGSTVVAIQALEAHSPDPDVLETSDRPLVYHNHSWHALGEHSRL